MRTANLRRPNYAVVDLWARLTTARCAATGTRLSTTKCKVNSLQEGYLAYFALSWTNFILQLQPHHDRSNY